MPQELHIVCCYKCETFQVDIVKKTKKWNCKICGEKQSLKKIYGSGSGKECRLQAQRLNDLRKNQEYELTKNTEKQCIEHQVSTSFMTDLKQNPVPSTSKWTQYVEINSIPTEERCQNYNRRTRSKTSSPYNKLKECEDQSRCGSTDRNCSSKLRKSTEINIRRRSYSLVNTTDKEQLMVSRKRPLYIAEESYDKAVKIPKLASKIHTNNTRNDSSSKWSRYASPKITGDNINNPVSQKRKHISVDTQDETPPKKRKERATNSNSKSLTEIITINLTNDAVHELNSKTNKVERSNKILDVNKSISSELLENKKFFVAVEHVDDICDLEEIQNTLTTQSTVTQKRKLDISNMGPIIPINKNAGWNLYFDSDTISEPSSNSSAFIELEEDNFEEFEFTSGLALPCSRKKFELFSTVKNGDDLDSILTI